MESLNESQEKDTAFDAAFDLDQTPSIDDFIRQLEEREKDLHIASDMEIEVEDATIETEEIFIEKIKAAEPAPKPVVERRKNPEPADYPENIEDLIERNSADLNETSFKKEEKPQLKTFSTINLEREVTKLKQEILKIEGEKAEMVQSMRRRHSDFENYRNRIERERNETFIAQLSNLAMQMLPVLDNLNRALDSAKGANTERSKDFGLFIDGIAMVNQQLMDVLGEMGVHPIPSVGQPFDPHLHEAVATEKADNLPHNTVIAELLRGYQIGEKVIRPSMVKVSFSSPQSTDSPQPSGAAGANNASVSADPEDFTELELD